MDIIRLLVTYRYVDRLSRDVAVVVGRFMYILTVQVFKHTYRGLRGCLISFLQVLIIQISVFDLVIVRGIPPDITIILSLVCCVLRHSPYNLVY